MADSTPPAPAARVLFVDDEPLIGQFAKRGLGQAGHDVVTCHDGAEALQTFLSQQGRFDVVITDQVMPRLSGDELARRLLAIRPDLPIILCTAYSQTIGRHEAKAIGIRLYVEKPYTACDLAAAIRQVLQ